MNQSADVVSVHERACKKGQARRGIVLGPCWTSRKADSVSLNKARKTFAMIT